jgi:uncharacterized HAD superfamily protein/hypoxanthine phosphoribosyltransferase
MNYVSVADLAAAIRAGLHKLPEDVDLVVGIPRSGMLPASLIALNLNVNCCDLQSFLAGVALHHGRTREVRLPKVTMPSHARHVLVVDDSVDSGETLASVKRSLAQIMSDQRLIFCAVYVTPTATTLPDVYLQVLSQPRLFEWNVMHRSYLRNCCVDIDGVLCCDPTAVENDDSYEYGKFLLAAKPLAVPSYPIGHLVTSRLEKYRPQTEDWLRRHGVQYLTLHMLDLPDAKTRRKLDCHAKFKAEVYSRVPTATLFIESDRSQAQAIAKLSGKYALSFGSQELFAPTPSAAVLQLSRGFGRRAVGTLRRLAGRILSESRR